MDEEIARQSEGLHSFLAGRFALTDENFTQAVSSFQRASNLLEEPDPELNALLAELYVRLGELENAKLEVEKALLIKPKHPPFLLLYAGVLESLNLLDEAEPVYQELMSREELYPEAYLLLAHLYSTEEKPEKSVEVLQALRKQKPDDLMALYYLGRYSESAGRLKESEDAFRQVYSSKQGDSLVVSDLLRVLLKQKKYSDVKKICQEILRDNPEHVLARRILSEIAIGDKDFDSAIEHLRVVEGAGETSSEVRFKIALLEIEKQNYGAAVRELNLVLASDTTNSQARYYLASIYAGSGRKKEALDELTKIKKDQEMFVKSRTFSAFLLRQENDLEGAEAAVREVLEVDERNMQAVAYLVLILRDAQKLTEAKELIEDALAFERENDRLLFQYGVILHDLGEGSKANEVMEEVIKINPRHTDALNFVAYAITEKGEDLSRAEELIRQAIEVRANDGYYLDTLGWILFKKGELTEATITLERAYRLASDDLVILEHYADALLAGGKHLQALELLRLGLEREDLAQSSEEQAQAYRRLQEKFDILSKEHPDLVVESTTP
jgi:tetratricopeptide (TPR) repeat protein